jgi:tetratricopeptide (TPR) repeat protein
MGDVQYGMYLRYLAPAIFCANAALADGCPVAPDHTASLDALFAQVQAAPNEMVARTYAQRMWTYWLDAPDEPSQMMLDEGMRAMRVGDYLRAKDSLDRLVSYCPFYAEGYNQRALLNYLRADYEAVLPDLDFALEFSPRHTGALTGKALTLIQLGRDDEAQEYLRDAVALNPWLGERALLVEPDEDDL